MATTPIPVEQDHRGITQRSYPMLGFGSFVSAARFCTAHDALRAHFHPHTRCNEAVSLADHRRRFGGTLGRGRHAASGGLADHAGGLPYLNDGRRIAVV